MRTELEVARQLIEEKQYDRARMVLRKAPDDPTAQKWLGKLDEMSQKAAPVPDPNEGRLPSDGWQYAALEVKRAFGVHYRFNGGGRPEWKDQPIFYALNELGRECWELVNFESAGEMTVYILKKQGLALENKKVEVWDQ